MGEAGGGGEVGGDGVALAEMAGDGGEVEAEGGSGGRAGGGDGDRARGISREEVHAVLEGFGEGVGVVDEGVKELRKVGMFDFAG